MERFDVLCKEMEPRKAASLQIEACRAALADVEEHERLAIEQAVSKAAGRLRSVGESHALLLVSALGRFLGENGNGSR